MNHMIDDNRFVLIEKYKQKLIEGTNISDSPEEMAVLDNILFRFWQMGWLDKLEEEAHWIPVEQDLPKENYLDDGYVEPSQPVLVYMSYRTCKISRYWGHRKSKGTSDYVIPDWMDLEDYEGDNVIAWMPLPEFYKGVTE